MYQLNMQNVVTHNNGRVLLWHIKLPFINDSKMKIVSLFDAPGLDSNKL